MSGPGPYDRWLPELLDFLRIRSVGADPAEADSMAEAAEWLATRLRAIGAHTALERDGRESVLLASIPAQVSPETAPTLLVYGHFDVQPPGDPELWESPPFEGTIRDGWLYGRGAIDTKGHLLMYLEATRAVLARGALAVNLRFMIDGAEESGGTLALRLLQDEPERPDGCLIFDGPMIAKGTPAFYAAARGMLAYKIELRTGARDLHSGQFGGAALNAGHALIRTLSAVLPGPSGLLPDGLRAGAAPLPADDVARWVGLPGADALLGGEGAPPADEHVADDLYTRLWAEPSLDVNGMLLGDAHLVHMVIPCEASARVSLRLAPGQDPEVIAAEFEGLLRAAAPQGARLRLERRGSSPAALLPTQGLVLEIARDAFRAEIGADPLTIRAGGTLPLLAVLGELAIPTVMTGMDLPEGNIHAPNERLWLEHLPLGTAILERILSDSRFNR